MISGRLRNLQEEILSVCNRLGIDPETIDLVGVTKCVDEDAIIEGIEAGLCHIGENKVQDAERKFKVLSQSTHQVKTHFIGHLQSNKVKSAIAIFDLIQSVDTQKLVQTIEKEAAILKKTVDILIQVNVAGEEQKFGVDPDDADALIEEAAGCAYVRVLGLMTMAPFTEDREVVRLCFRGLKKMFDRYADIYTEHNNIRMEILSMGMTSDYIIALEEGSNMFRIGRAIFQ